MSKFNSTKSLAEIAEDRRWEFADEFGNCGFSEEAIIKCIENLEVIAATCFGADVSRSGFDQMIGHYFKEDTANLGWERALDENFTSLYSELPLGTLFHDLEAYANYGIVTTLAASVSERESVLRQQVESGQKFVSLIPLEAWGIDGEYAISIVRKAAVRWKLDTGIHVNAEELASISGLALQSIRNRVSGQTKEIEGNQNHIDAKEALLWLQSRKDFKESIWRHQTETAVTNLSDTFLKEVIFVPVALDGTVFHPGLKRNEKYIIGFQDDETAVSDYYDALAQLQSAKSAQWRRPTKGGTWTRVQATSWKRMTKEELEEEPSIFHNLTFTN